MRNEAKLASEIAKQLDDRLEDRYQIFADQDLHLFTGTSSSAAPDVTVFDSDTGNVFFVEVKGSGPDRDLPYATSPAMKRLVESNAWLGPQMILVTASGVPNELRTSLRIHHIHLVEGTSAAEIVPPLMDFVRNPEVQGDPPESTESHAAS